jgi:hypothetical protein
MLAHIVGSGSPWPLWITAALLFGGAVASMFAPRRWHRFWVAVALVGGGATILVYVLVPGAPAAPPGLSLHIGAPVAGATVTSPVVLRICDGATRLPGAGWLLDDYYHRVVLLGVPPFRDLLGPPGEMFRFFRGDPARTGRAMDLVISPCCTDPLRKAESLRALNVVTDGH